MGKKYIIELEDKPFHKEDGDFLYRVKGFNSLVFDMTGIGMLTPYTEPDLERTKKTAYDDGYSTGYQAGREDLNRVMSDMEQVREEAFEEGKKQSKVQAELDVCHDIGKVAKANYQQGLNDAWDAVRKIYSFDLEEREELFHDSERFNVGSICEAYSASEAIEKIRQYEQEQEEIKVGDEVVFGNDEEIKAVVIDEADEAGVWLLLSEKGCVERMDGVLFHRTGRHFSELTSIFEKMREE